ncbi:MAG: hypothetical protein IK081_16190 [Lachnospiraceae bacterium]|nr:hypothetical protein [Lachnospiraceae bacterium]
MEFLNALASYGLLLLCFVAVGVVAVFFGIFMRKRKDAALEREAAANADQQENA